MEHLLATARHLNVLKLVLARTTNQTHTVVTVTSNHGNDSLQVQQLPGNKNDSIVTTTDLATKADLELLPGRVAIVVPTATAAMVVLLVAALHPGSSRHLHHRLQSANLAIVTVRILAMIKVLVTEHLQRQLRQASARSCNNMLVHLRLPQVTGHHRLHHLTTLPHRLRLLITLHHLPQHERGIPYNAGCSVEDG